MALGFFFLIKLRFGGGWAERSLGAGQPAPAASGANLGQGIAERNKRHGEEADGLKKERRYCVPQRQTKSELSITTTLSVSLPYPKHTSSQI